MAQFRTLNSFIGSKMEARTQGGPKVYSNMQLKPSCFAHVFFSCFQGGAATEVYKMILKETGDAMSARVREVFQRRSLKRQSTHFGHLCGWMAMIAVGLLSSGDKGGWVYNAISAISMHLHPLTSFCAHQGTRVGCRFDSDGGGYLDRDELARVFRTSHGPFINCPVLVQGLWRLSYRIPLSMVNGWLSKTIPRKS